MGFRLRRRIRRTPAGTVEVRLNDRERAELAHLADQVYLLLDDSTDPALRRLFPPAYAEDAVRDAAFQMLMGDDLRQAHLAAVDALRTGARAQLLEPAEAEAWMKGLNAGRLIVGTRLDITDDHGPVVVAPDDPDLPLWMAYEFLTELLGELVEALMG